MEITNRNYVKKLLKEGKRVTGAWAQGAGPIFTEILADAGFDLVMIDMEHGPGDILTLIGQIQGMKGQPAVPFVRAPWNDFVQIKKILDAGTFGLLVPYVNTPEEARLAVQATKYPLEGIRGVAGSPRGPHYGNNAMDYMKAANDEIFVMTAIETMEAIGNIDDVLAVEGLDGIFIGPMDLASSMGYFGDPSHPEVQKAIHTVEKKVIGSGKILATVADKWETACIKYDVGYQLLMLMSDTNSLGAYARGLTKSFRDSYPNR